MDNISLPTNSNTILLSSRVWLQAMAVRLTAPLVIRSHDAKTKFYADLYIEIVLLEHRQKSPIIFVIPRWGVSQSSRL